MKNDNPPSHSIRSHDSLDSLQEISRFRGIDDPEQRIAALEQFLVTHYQPLDRQYALKQLWATLLTWDRDRALTWIDRALATETSRRGLGTLYTALLEYHLQHDQREEAVHLAERFYRTGTGNTASLHAVARLLLNADLGLEWALRLAERGARRDEPSDFGGHIKSYCLEAAGLCYLKLGDIPSAKERLETAVEIVKDSDSQIYANLIEIYKHTGEREKLAEMKKIMLELNKDQNR